MFRLIRSYRQADLGNKNKKIRKLLLFINIPTYGHRSSIKLILKLLRHVSVFLHHPQDAYMLCQPKL